MRFQSVFALFRTERLHANFEMGMANEMRKNPVRVGMYDVEKTIGKGNFAVVKLARHRITKSQVRVNTSP